MSCTRLNLWSGPRNVSTALMYSFAQRADTRAIDEPLYAHHLARSGAPHPGRDDVLKAQDTDGEAVVRDVVLGPCDRPVLFLKQMAHHALGLDWGFLGESANALLVREPGEMLTSLVRVTPEPTLIDTALDTQAALLEHLRELGQDPPVIEARLLLDDPRGVLSRLCKRVGIAFDEAMLSWPAGAKSCDGVWAPHWYASVHRSTGFRPYARKDDVVPERLEPLLAECLPYYEALRAEAARTCLS